MDDSIYGRVDSGAESICGRVDRAGSICREGIQVSQARNTADFCVIRVMHGHSDFLFW